MSWTPDKQRSKTIISFLLRRFLLWREFYDVLVCCCSAILRVWLELWDSCDKLSFLRKPRPNLLSLFPGECVRSFDAQNFHVRSRKHECDVIDVIDVMWTVYLTKLGSHIFKFQLAMMAPDSPYVWPPEIQPTSHSPAAPLAQSFGPKTEGRSAEVSAICLPEGSLTLILVDPND